MNESISQDEIIEYIETSATALAEKNSIIQKQAAEIEDLKSQLYSSVKYANSLKEENEQILRSKKVASAATSSSDKQEFLSKEEADSIISNLNALGLVKHAADKNNAEILLKNPRSVYGLMTILMEKCASAAGGSIGRGNNIGRMVAASATKITIPLTSAEKLEQKILKNQ